jgi:monoamine oxidase
MPKMLPILTGWAPFHCAEALSCKGADFVADQALVTLGRILGLSPKELGGQLEAAYTHDWQNDPFSRGAYSYVKVGGDNAERELSCPIDDTLFFAGEATDFRGYNGTVHAAIFSGKRAAAELLRSL